MNKRQIYLAVSIFAFALCLAFTFNESEVVWAWTDLKYVPVLSIVIGLISTSMFLTSKLKSPSE